MLLSSPMAELVVLVLGLEVFPKYSASSPQIRELTPLTLLLLVAILGHHRDVVHELRHHPTTIDLNPLIQPFAIDMLS